MALIDSPDNRIPKLLRALHTRKGRVESGLTLVEGPKVIAEALAAERLAFLAWCPEVADAGVAGKLLGAAELAGVPVHQLARRAFAATADTVTPTGLVGAAGTKSRGLRDLAIPKRAVLLALYEVRDPGNAGTMIRSADAFRASAAVAVEDCVDFYEPKVVRASTGTAFRVNLATARWAEFRQWAQDEGVVVVAADLGGDVPLPELQWPERAAILIGNEAHGLPASVLQQAGARVKIPMPGRAESLNAAMAAGILLYEAARASASRQLNTQGDDGEK